MFVASNTRFAVALHVLAFLASREGPVKSSLIARSVGTNPVVVRRIIARLAEAGIDDPVKPAQAAQVKQLRSKSLHSQADKKGNQVHWSLARLFPGSIV